MQLLGHGNHGNPRHQALSTFLLMLMPGEVWNSAVIESAEGWQLLRALALSDPTLKLDMVCRFSGRVAVVPKRFHFAIPLTVDRGISRE